MHTVPLVSAPVVGVKFVREADDEKQPRIVSHASVGDAKMAHMAK